MRRFIATLLCIHIAIGLLPLTGCQPAVGNPASTPDAGDRPSDTTSRLIGTWSGSFQLKPDAPIDEFDKATIDICKSIRMQIKFHANDRLDMSASMTLPEVGVQSNETSGNWSVLAENGNEVRLQAMDADGAPEEITIVFQDDRTFTMTPPNELFDLGTLTFTKN